ncbi:MAG: NCS2 family permease [Thermoplasmata archaeon]|jgi:AGZA family xanthine/uracil permease-like MFS transporter|nr:NCS2 family permease [Thermoplasmata archaeon]
MGSFLDSVDSFFRISERGSSFGTEIKGGLITFLSMSYILVVNPFILEGAAEGYTFLQLFTATALAAALSCLLMGFYARFPVSLAPGMGINAFMAFTICYSMGFTFEQALAVVLVSGIAFFLISVTGLRKRIIEDIPNSMKLAITAGIGFFIVVIGLYNSGLIDSGETSAMTLGNLSDSGVLLSLLCIATTLAMWLRNRWYAVIGSILMTWAIGLVLAFMGVYSETGLIPELEGVKLVSMPDATLFGKVFEGFTLEGAMIVPFIAAAISLLVVNIFDTTGTLIGVSKAAGLMDDEGHAEGIDKAMKSDAAGSIIGAVCGTSTTTSFIESATGIESGARTGLMTVVVGLLFFVSLILGGAMATFTSACTVGALVLVGIMMIRNVREIDWHDPLTCAMAFMTIFMMGLSGSITNGIAAGVFVYVGGLLVLGRRREVPATLWMLTILFLVYFVINYAAIPLEWI